MPSFREVAAKTIVVHTVSYMVMGLLALQLLDYAALYRQPDMAMMRPTTHPLVMAGPLFQPLRGLVFALAMYPLREVIFGRPNGWLVLWWVLVALGIISTFGAAPGSIEGLVYTNVTVPHQLIGMIEVVTQAALLAFGVVYWVGHPEKRWLTRVLVIAFALAVLLPVVGLIAGR